MLSKFTYADSQKSTCGLCLVRPTNVRCYSRLLLLGLSCICLLNTSDKNASWILPIYLHRSSNPTATPLLAPMSVNHANDIIPASKGSPTQRHIHNYSLPSPFCAPLPTTHRPTRCRSSPALSEFRQAVYIPGPYKFHGAEEASLQDVDLTVAKPYTSCKSVRAVQVGVTCTPTMAALRTPGLEPGLNAVLHPSSTSFLLSAPSIRQKRGESHTLRFSSVSPTSCPSSSRRPSTLPSRALIGRLNRLSAASITSLPFPLPTPPGLGSDAEWEIDPFAAGPYSISAGGRPSSRWSSSTSSLPHQSKSAEALPERDQSTFEKFTGNNSAPLKLKELLRWLSINRNPATSGFHFRSQSARNSGDAVVREQKSKTPDTMMMFDESIFVNEEEEPDPPVEENITQSDDANILGSTIRALSRMAAKKNVCLIDTGTSRLDPADMTWNNSQVEASTMSATSPTSTDTSLMSTPASISKHIDVDRIAVPQDKSIIASSVENPLYDCIRTPHAPAPFLSPTMRIPLPDVLPSSSNFPEFLHHPALHHRILRIPFCLLPQTLSYISIFRHRRHSHNI
ncbi:hypothetical protein B0H12DRAFT_570990 [Mycena haematopus]|nr:hypothetical protein B0H12DRAFT_570990 [Mycena haematopus]